MIRQRLDPPEHAQRKEIETDWRTWLHAMFPRYVDRSFAGYHEEYWDWVWSLDGDCRARPFVAIWPRGVGKSTSTELACAMVTARRMRRYALYIGETQEQADDHVSNVAGLLESSPFAETYPDASSRRVGKYGNVRGWRRNRLRTASGFTLDAIGLDTAARGVKLDEDRPDLLIFDDIDGKRDSLAASEKKITTITHTLIPAGSDNSAVLAVQNLVIPDGVFSRLADGRADFLADRIVSGPHPAIENLTYETRDGKTIITGGVATWPEGMSLATCQQDLNLMGITAFLAEKQHDVEAPAGGMFDHLTFRHCTWDTVPDLVRTVVWVDPAVTETDNSDSHGIQADGIAPDGTVYRLYSWEARTSPTDSLKRAILKAVELGADHVGVETDQGGDTWKSTYREAVNDLVNSGEIARSQAPRFASEKAGAGYGSKTHRAGQMLAAYERGAIVHVTGTHETLERALKRFPKTKPFDLCLAMGTLVETAYGPVPIEDIRAGDWVHTRRGLRRVRWAGCTALAAPLWTLRTVDNRVVRGTAGHPIWVQNRGWVPLSSVRCDDIVLVWKDSDLISSKQTESFTYGWSFGILPLILSNLAAISTCFMKIATTTARLVATRTGGKHSTGKFGKRLTARFPKGMTFTMWMATREIMTWRISAALAVLSTENSTVRHGRWSPRCWRILRQFVPRQQSGMQAKKGTHGTSRLVSLRGKVAKRGRFVALSVAKNLRHGMAAKQSYARGLVGMLLPPETRSTTKRDNVRNVERHFGPGSITDRCIAAVPVQIVFGPETNTPNPPVYNLTIERDHEFFANGILTHNCDAAYWAWRDLAVPKGQPRRRTPLGAAAAIVVPATDGWTGAHDRRRR